MRMLWLALILAVCTVAQGRENIRAIRIVDGRTITIDELVGMERKRGILFLGEYHDNPAHHINQIEIIKRLYRLNESIAIGLEMFRNSYQKDLDGWVAGTISEEVFVKIFNMNWNHPWELYRDIFIFCRDHRIPMIALNVDKTITSKVSEHGFSSLSADDLKQLPTSVSCSVDKSYMDFIQKTFAAHGRTGRSFLHFCEAQLLWDEVMAHYLLEYRKENSSRSVLVLAGSSHSWKKGVPRQLEKAGVTDYVVILPGVNSNTPSAGLTIADADYLIPD